jgi:cell division protein FtsL
MEEVNQNPDFKHGYSSGIEGASADPYEQFLSSQVHYGWLSQRIDEKRTELNGLDQKIAENTTLRKSAFDRLQQFVLRVSNATKNLQEFDYQRNTIDTETEALKSRRKQTQSEYSLAAGLLFFGAGVSFVFGDLIISHEIVAYALNIRDNYDAWAFAIGLAMISVLLKPAYDRLIEKPYTTQHTPQAQTRYARFKIGLAVFAFVTLAILGWFRYEAYRTDKLKEAINKSVKNIQLNATPLDGTTAISPQQQQQVLKKVEEQLQKSEELNLGLVNSPWALASFVLSGVLFAMAGAVSLGMGLPVLQNFWYRWLQIDPRLGRLRRRRKKLLVQLTAAQKELSDDSTQKNILEHELALIPSLDDLRSERSQLRNDIDALIETTRLAQTDSRIATYNDGYSKGEIARELMNDEEFSQFKNRYMNTNNLAIKASSSADRSLSTANKQGLRPHQLVRKIITDGFDESY